MIGQNPVSAIEPQNSEIARSGADRLNDHGFPL